MARARIIWQHRFLPETVEYLDRYNSSPFPGWWIKPSQSLLATCLKPGDRTPLMLSPSTRNTSSSMGSPAYRKSSTRNHVSHARSNILCRTSFPRRGVSNVSRHRFSSPTGYALTSKAVASPSPSSTPTIAARALRIDFPPLVHSVIRNPGPSSTSKLVPVIFSRA